MPDFADSSDVLNLSTALRRHTVNRVSFDPSSESHLDSFDMFLRTGNWGDIQFFCEHPYTDVPMTVLMKFAMYKQSVQRETRAEHLVRTTGMNLAAPIVETTEQKQKRLHDTNARMALQVAA